MHCENKVGIHFFTLNFDAIIGITSHYCVILKIVLLHNGIKTTQNVYFLLSLKKERNLVSFNKKTFF